MSKRKDPGIKLDIACGKRKQEGHVGIDIAPDSDADIKHDLTVYPWPVEDASVKEAFCSHYVEHIPHQVDGSSADGWWLFWDEVHRVMRKGAQIKVHHPYVRSDRAFWDPTHTRYIHEMTWYYLDANWRKEQGLDHYPSSADFEVVVINGIGVPDAVVNRSVEQQEYMRAHYWNCVPDLEVILRKR